jgi:hypothetical protein
MSGWLFGGFNWWLEMWFWLGLTLLIIVFSVRYGEYTNWRTRGISWANTAFGLGAWFQGMKTWWKKYPIMAFFYFLGGPVWWLVAFFKVLVIPFVVYALWPFVLLPVGVRLKPAVIHTGKGIVSMIEWMSK